MKATGNIGGWVEIVKGPSDRELAYLYKNCEFLAMPSLYEGWGLPVGEALSYGKTAVVSNTSSLPEVGLDLVEYCDPTSIDSIAEACLRLIADPDRRLALEQKIRESTLRSWDDVARDLVSAVIGK
jgi:glycosyltransferase involved in cell wall biosynthesis